jgi:hypothetical protein
MIKINYIKYIIFILCNSVTFHGTSWVDKTYLNEVAQKLLDDNQEPSMVSLKQKPALFNYIQQKTKDFIDFIHHKWIIKNSNDSPQLQLIIDGKDQKISELIGFWIISYVEVSLQTSDISILENLYQNTINDLIPNIEEPKDLNKLHWLIYYFYMGKETTWNENLAYNMFNAIESIRLIITEDIDGDGYSHNCFFNTLEFCSNGLLTIANENQEAIDLNEIIGDCWRILLYILHLFKNSLDGHLNLEYVDESSDSNTYFSFLMGSTPLTPGKIKQYGLIVLIFQRVDQLYGQDAQYPLIQEKMFALLKFWRNKFYDDYLNGLNGALAAFYMVLDGRWVTGQRVMDFFDELMDTNMNFFSLAALYNSGVYLESRLKLKKKKLDKKKYEILLDHINQLFMIRFRKKWFDDLFYNSFGRYFLNIWYDFLKDQSIEEIEISKTFIVNYLENSSNIELEEKERNIVIILENLTKEKGQTPYILDKTLENFNKLGKDHWVKSMAKDNGDRNNGEFHHQSMDMESKDLLNTKPNQNIKIKTYSSSNSSSHSSSSMVLPALIILLVFGSIMYFLLDQDVNWSEKITILLGGLSNKTKTISPNSSLNHQRTTLPNPFNYPQKTLVNGTTDKPMAPSKITIKSHQKIQQNEIRKIIRDSVIWFKQSNNPRNSINMSRILFL